MSDTDLRPASGLRPSFRQATGTRDADNTGGFQRPVSGEPRVALWAKPARAHGRDEATTGPNGHGGPLPDGGRGTSGRGDTNGHTLRPARGRGDQGGPQFHLDVPPNGYAWWYVDGISSCGTKAISIISFIGSVFSPWYAWSGRKDPDNHCCINVATYGPGGRFTMTDRGRKALRTTRDTFQVGPSQMRWDGEKLIFDINEISSPPLVSRVRGQVTVTPRAVTDVELPLAADGTHVWRPFAPLSDITVDLEATGWQWSGHGYFDANFGTRALEQDFNYWTWGCFPHSDGATAFYDVTRRDGSQYETAIAFCDNGSAEHVEAPPLTRFKNSLWQVRRETRADPGATPKQHLSMLDAPFYSRSAVRTRLNGEDVLGVHEALDLRRFASPLLKPMLAVRVPRRAGWRWPD